MQLVKVRGDARSEWLANGTIDYRTVKHAFMGFTDYPSSYGLSEIWRFRKHKFGLIGLNGGEVAVNEAWKTDTLSASFFPTFNDASLTITAGNHRGLLTSVTQLTDQTIIFAIKAKITSPGNRYFFGNAESSTATGGWYVYTQTVFAGTYRIITRGISTSPQNIVLTGAAHDDLILIAVVHTAATRAVYVYNVTQDALVTSAGGVTTTGTPTIPEPMRNFSIGEYWFSNAWNQAEEFFSLLNFSVALTEGQINHVFHNEKSALAVWL